MKRKNKVIFAIILIILILLGIGGTKKLVEMKQSAQKETLITFLKKHESEMTSYIRKNSNNNVKVKYYWNTVQRKQNMAFSRPTISIKFDAIDQTKTEKENYYNQGNTLVIDTDEKVSQINDMWTTGAIIEKAA